MKTKAKECRELVENLVDIVEMTCCHFTIGATESQREERVAFIYQICKGTGFASVKIRSDLVLCYRKMDKGETFFLVSRDDESDWVKEMKSGFADLGYRFETRKVVENLGTYLLNLESLFGGKGPA